MRKVSQMVKLSIRMRRWRRRRRKLSISSSKWNSFSRRGSTRPNGCNRITNISWTKGTIAPCRRTVIIKVIVISGVGMMRRGRRIPPRVELLLLERHEVHVLLLLLLLLVVVRLRTSCSRGAVPHSRNHLGPTSTFSLHDGIACFHLRHSSL
uniref:Uncharacterized protein n=1 Tax=Lepeophtheirus salmonis TaxID=72036 RepID=A0A0K2UT84_LEPSM